MRHRSLVVVPALFILCAPAAAASQSDDRAGDRYEIRLERASETAGDRSSGTSHDVWTLTERVVALRDRGVELEFDLPADTSPEDRARGWQFPARVFRSPDQPLELLNAAEAETRLRSWLTEQERTMCGHWIFTWTAQKIECDPQSVLEVLEPFLQPKDLREGSAYREVAASAPAPLRIQAQTPNGATFVVEMEVDPEVVRRGRAETDVIVSQMTSRTSLNLDAAQRAHAREQISGAITVRFETDSDDRVVRRTRVTRIDIASENGSHERVTTTETTEWRAISRSANK